MTTLLCAFGGLGSGCLFETSETVDFQHDDAGSGSDVAADGETDADEVRDTSETPDLSPGTVCEGAPTPGEIPACTPVVPKSECGTGRFCDVVVASPGSPPTFEVDCRLTRLTIENGGLAGDSCNDNDGDPNYAPCQPGHRCVTGTCYRYCRLSDGGGCADGQSCQAWFPPDQITNFGLCVAVCGDL